MTVTVVTEGRYAVPATELFGQATDWTDLKRVMSGLAEYRGLPDGPVVQGDQITVDIVWLGFIPAKGHHISVHSVDAEARAVAFRESNATTPRWDHDLTVTARDGGASWRDAVTIDAGAATWLVARFARYMYRRRHRRRGAVDIVSRIGPAT